jgi:hypothetical protein
MAGIRVDGGSLRRRETLFNSVYRNGSLSLVTGNLETPIGQKLNQG